MKISEISLCFIGLLAGLCVPAQATVQIVSITPSLNPPQLIGTPITWTVTATDSNPGPLTFQFNVALPQHSLAMVRDFNAGTLNAGTWTSLPFVWVPTAVEGSYTIQVVIKDFKSGENTSRTLHYTVTPLVTGSTPVVVATAHPLVALFSAPACPAGSSMRVSFQKQAQPGSLFTNYLACHPPSTMTFEIAGMYPSTAYTMFSQTKTAGNITNGPSVAFTTGALPGNIAFPSSQVIVPSGPHTDNTDRILLANHIQMGVAIPYLQLATDLSGRTLWYYYQNDSSTHFSLLTRPLAGGTMLTIQDGPAWNPATQAQQTLRQIDLAGNIIKETNIGILQQELLALGDVNAGPCDAISKPAPVGAACLGGFHHEAIQTLPNGYTAVLAAIEKIFPAGTQGDTSGLPVDIIGDIIIVLNQNWQPVWYFDSFDHAAGGPNELDINRPAILGEICVVNQAGCPPILLLSSGIAGAKDWLHANSLYYWPTDSAGGASGDLVWSSRHQDWIVKIDYNNGAGTGNILWIMGLDGSFTFNNINNDPYPWFSHQHEAAMENNGAGPMTIFDNGNTRISAPPTGLGNPGCKPNDCNSRGMALTIDENALQVTPVLSQDLGVFSTAMGGGQLLTNGNYFFFAAIVLVSLQAVNSYNIEIYPTAGTTGGTQVLNVGGLEGYRGWQIRDLYSPPLT